MVRILITGLILVAGALVSTGCHAEAGVDKTATSLTAPR